MEKIMLLKKIILQNFRGYKNKHTIEVDQLTAFIGKNDAGKSSIFDALAIFFDHPLAKIDSSDYCVHAGKNGELRIGCVFDNFPEQIVIDSTTTTTLKNEYLLNCNGELEIHKVHEFSDGNLKKAKIYAIANHPTAKGYEDLLSKKINELKTLAKTSGIDNGVDKRSSAALRKALWESLSELQLKPSLIQLDKEDAKAIWEQLSKHLPEYALFRADRPSTDEDSEVQDPLKVAIKQAIEDVQTELDAVKEKVKMHTIYVAQRTIKKLADFDETLSSQLKPVFKSDPKWDSLFKISLTGEDEIPINKRGSGVRRLILFSFFRAEAERLREKHKKNNIIYAIEEPETAQHPYNQRKVIEALQTIAEVDGCQVMLTTHVPALASLLPINSVRYVSSHDENNNKIFMANDEIIQKIIKDLGIIPDKRAKVLVCMEGPHDLQFLKRINQLLKVEDNNITDIFTDPRVAFVVLGGSTLQEWVNQHYLRNIGLPEVHIYDRDELRNGKYKYQDAKDKVCLRRDGSEAFLTTKREMENYLHIDAINDTLKPIVDHTFNFILSDDCDVESEIRAQLNGQGRIQRRTIKNWLNEDVANNMTLERLKERNGYEEIKSWFTAIESKFTY
ncbi:TPA: AAA family ATPase [Legionella pneumophila]|nr:AAA family ATPase [Legionella pneumophila]HAT8869564.1 AAA family ATPase [Legionella pneumophila subsp. pneumophila]HAT8643172.1 AAA family ATPase [Legionella pneumophila]HAT8891308.1 AAA family ATPase [Legionella pneumophila subsp. pneumophila]HAT8934780.1 AAA family ATPase [Legionella pneumophila subsp. pneumophila]